MNNPHRLKKHLISHRRDSNKPRPICTIYVGPRGKIDEVLAYADLIGGIEISITDDGQLSAKKRRPWQAIGRNKYYLTGRVTFVNLVGKAVHATIIICPAVVR